MLRAAVRSSGQSLPARMFRRPLPDLSAAAAIHGIQGFVLQSITVTGPHRAGLESEVHRSLARYQRILADLRVVEAALRAVDVPYLLVKGPALVVQYYAGDPRLRDSVDLDILVRPHHLSLALAALESSGCQLVDANWPLLASLQVHELRLLGPSGGPIDLHWSLGPGPGEDAYAPPVDVLLGRSRSIEIEGLSVRTLDWADTVVHLAVHAASSGGNRLIWCADLRAVLAQSPPGATQLLVSRAEEWRARPGLHLMLVRARRATGMPLSHGLLEQLSPSRPWSALVRFTEWVAPVSRAAPGPSLTRIIARSARVDARTSWPRLFSKAVQVVTHGGDRTSPLDLRNPDDPRSGLFPAGGSEGRAAFVAGVVKGPADMH
jgi:hypothetical protein